MQITTLQYHTFIDSNPSSYVDVFTAGYLVITPPLVLIGGLLAEGRTRDVCRFGQPRRADWSQKGPRNNGRLFCRIHITRRDGCCMAKMGLPQLVLYLIIILRIRESGSFTQVILGFQKKNLIP